MESYLTQAAIITAARLHRTQFRKTPIVTYLPYVSHCVEVMKQAWRLGIGTEVNCMAAVMHDILEDCVVKTRDPWLPPGSTAKEYEPIDPNDLHTRVFGNYMLLVHEEQPQIALDPIEVNKTIEAAVNIVKELTFYEETMSKQEYIDSFVNKSLEALVIKAIDRKCNCEDYAADGNTKYAKKYRSKANVIFELILQQKHKINEKYPTTTLAKLEDLGNFTI